MGSKVFQSRILPNLKRKKINKMAQELATMTVREREVLEEITKKDCLEGCLHCPHSDLEAHDPKLHFRVRYCGACRVYMFHRMQDWQLVEFEDKSKKIEKDGTQEFMSTGRVFFCDPPSYEYIHVNSGKKFTSGHVKLEDAITEYLADPDRDLTFDELMHKNLRIRSEQRAKVFAQTYGVDMSAPATKELQEKFARIDKYSGNEFVSLNAIKPYRYVHLNEHITFESEHSKISEAIRSYLDDYGTNKPQGSLRKPYELDNSLGQIL